VWGLGQIGAARIDMRYKVVDALLPLCAAEDSELRSQAARVLVDLRGNRAFDALAKLLADPEARPRFFAAIALGKLARKEARGALLQMLRENDNRDRYLRHAGIMGLVGCADAPYLKELTRDISPAVRLPAVVALRRMGRPEVTAFLNDTAPEVVLEAARAINDLPVATALPGLAERINQASSLARSIPRPADTRPSTFDIRHSSFDYLTPLVRRIVNANFRLGGGEQAKALAQFASAADLPETLRADALTLLGQWPKPSGRDAVTGLWRKLPPRPGRVASEALQAQLPTLLEGSSAAIKIAALKAAGALGVNAAVEPSLALAGNSKESPAVRVAALKALAALKSPRLEQALNAALGDADETVLREATQLQASVNPSDAIEQLRTALERGGLGEKQSAFIALGNLTNSAAADALLLEWLGKLIAQQVPTELHVDLLEAAGKRTHREVQEKLRQFETTRPPEDDLRAFRECLTGGNKEVGQKIFIEKPEVSCVRCHKAAGEGGEVGPDLTGIGARRDRQYILEGIVLPNKEVAAGFESVVITTKSGATYAGTLKSENDGLMELKKSEIKSRERAPSSMPEEFRQVLTKRELRDLVEFLAELK
jgi:quinoprotein glucose dehydrogenase